MKNDVCVFVQFSGGRPSGISFEALSLARSVAGFIGGTVTAVYMDVSSDDIADTLIAYGADRVIFAETALPADASPDVWLNMQGQAAKSLSPSIIIYGGTKDSREQAARLSARLNAAYISDAVGVAFSGQKIEWKRFAFSGSVLQRESVCAECAVVTVRPSAFKKLEPDYARRGSIDTMTFDCASGPIRQKVLDVLHAVSSDINIEDAEVVVCAGRGIGSKETFDRLYVLADLLGGVVGGTRPIVEAGWLTKNMGIGQSEKSVSPRLYVAFGVSGAVQHLAGLAGADYIVAVNRDEEAPIFGAANVGIVGDAKETLEIMIEEINKLKSNI